jgi:protein-S-isoprenylcysteine O-methyltransferase Ste14
MAWLAVALLLLFGVVCLGVRTWIHYRETGRSPFLTGPAGHGLVAVLGFVGPFAVAIVLDLAGSAPRLVDSAWVGALGTVLAVAGIVATMWAQLAMGDSWRVGIDNDERTDLVTGGPYESVRNPIYTAMFTFSAGIALVVPNIASAIGFVLVVVVIDIVVRRMEEPYLVATHGDRFREWAARTGRFFPGIGRVKSA